MKKQQIVSENFEKNNDKKQDKNTKQKSNAQKIIPWLIIAVVSLVIILACVLIAYYQVYKSEKQNSKTLEGIYASSYFSMVDNINNLSVDLSKYSTLTTRQAKLNKLQDMMQDCNYVVSGLSVLPVDAENVMSATKFFNQVNGVCEAYTNVLNKNENLTQEQELLFDEIALVLGQIKENFNYQNYGMYDTGFNFIDAGIFTESGMTELSASMGDLTSDAIDYPTMIFDGPFSTALETAIVKGLPMEEVSVEDAKRYLNEVVYKNRDAEITYKDTTEGDIATFNFDVEIAKKNFTAQVSKRGGLLITISGYATEGDAIIGAGQAQEMAKTFANNVGFENMQSVWCELHDNVAYVNLAPKVNNVIYYPDLVKVKVDLTDQEIIGFEALNYALNHVVRNAEFNVEVENAEKLLGFDYEILNIEKTVIRLDSGKEVYAYEFFVERIDGIYFYYIDANTNQIVKTLKLVTIKNVEKLI
ncbi:MAG: germination protein YpeB [Clostridia bacterium]|nr:germination protein YpeB [Clostridia bacterium]